MIWFEWCTWCAGRINAFHDLEPHELDPIKRIEVAICFDCWDKNIRKLARWECKPKPKIIKEDGHTIDFEAIEQLR